MSKELTDLVLLLARVVSDHLRNPLAVASVHPREVEAAISRVLISHAGRTEGSETDAALAEIQGIVRQFNEHTSQLSEKAKSP
jgi:hypothetical protein